MVVKNHFTLYFWWTWSRVYIKHVPSKFSRGDAHLQRKKKTQPKRSLFSPWLHYFPCDKAAWQEEQQASCPRYSKFKEKKKKNKAATEPVTVINLVTNFHFKSRFFKDGNDNSKHIDLHITNTYFRIRRFQNEQTISLSILSSKICTSCTQELGSTDRAGESTSCMEGTKHLHARAPDAESQKKKKINDSSLCFCWKLSPRSPIIPDSRRRCPQARIVKRLCQISPGWKSTDRPSDLYYSACTRDTDWPSKRHAVSAHQYFLEVSNRTLMEETKLPPDHLLLDSVPNLGPLISRWEINKFKNCWYKSVRILEVLELLFQQFLHMSSSDLMDSCFWFTTEFSFPRQVNITAKWDFHLHFTGLVKYSSCQERWFHHFHA